MTYANRNVFTEYLKPTCWCLAWGRVPDHEVSHRKHLFKLWFFLNLAWTSPTESKWVETSKSCWRCNKFSRHVNLHITWLRVVKAFDESQYMIYSMSLYTRNITVSILSHAKTQKTVTYKLHIIKYFVRKTWFKINGWMDNTFCLGRKYGLLHISVVHFQISLLLYSAWQCQIHGQATLVLAMTVTDCLS